MQTWNHLGDAGKKSLMHLSNIVAFNQGMSKIGICSKSKVHLKNSNNKQPLVLSTSDLEI